MIALICSMLLAGGCLCLVGIRRPRRQPGPAMHPQHILTSVGAALFGAVVGLIATGLPVVALLTMTAGAAVPTVLQRRRSSREQRERLAAWPGFLDDVTSAVRAGMSLPEALASAGERSPAPQEFTTFATDYRRSGDFSLALAGLQSRLSDPVFEQVAQALIVTREVGGSDLTTVLRSLSGFVRDALHLRGELEARQSWTINSARMAVAAPWVVLLLLASRPATIAAYSQLRGALLLAGVALASTIAYVMMLRIAQLPAVAS